MIYTYQHNNIIVLLIEHAKVDNIVIDLRKGNRKKTKTKTKQNRPHWQKKGTKPKQRNTLGWQWSNKFIKTTWWRINSIYGVLGKNDIVQRQINERTDLPMDN